MGIRKPLTSKRYIPSGFCDKCGYKGLNDFLVSPHLQMQIGIFLDSVSALSAAGIFQNLASV